MRTAFLPFVGSFFLAVLQGCKYDRVECTSAQSRLIREARSWVNENKDTIDARMAEKWRGKREAEMNDVVWTLNNAKIECGIGNGESGAAASWIELDHRIMIDVSDSYVKYTFRSDQAHRWTMPLFTGTAAQRSANLLKYPSLFEESLQYVTALGMMGLLLVHEAAHGVLGGHSKEARARLEEIETRLGGEFEPADTKDVDEIHGLGYWTFDASQIVWAQMADASLAPR